MNSTQPFKIAKRISLALLVVGVVGFAVTSEWLHQHLTLSEASRLHAKTLNSTAHVRVDDSDWWNDESALDDSADAGPSGSRGSGFFISPHILVTNAHVVEDERRTTLITEDWESWSGFVAIADTFQDIAIVYTPGPRPWLPLRDTEAIVGEPVYALGSPRGNFGSVSAGVVSQPWASTDDWWGMVAFTNVIAPGSSGGALVDRNGSVVGVTTTGDRFGYAIPVASIRIVLNRLRHRVQESKLGFADYVRETCQDSVGHILDPALTHQDSLVLGLTAPPKWTGSIRPFLELFSAIVAGAGLLGTLCVLILWRHRHYRRLSERQSTRLVYDGIRQHAFLPEQLVTADCGPPARWYNRVVSVRDFKWRRDQRPVRH